MPLRVGECGVCGAMPSGAWGRTECDETTHRGVDPYVSRMRSDQMRVDRDRRVNVGEDLRHLREMSGLSMVEVASILGVSSTAVMKWEYGLAAPSGDRLEELYDLLDVLGELAS